VSDESKLFSVAGKCAVVTGGVKGIGAMISNALLRSGADVIAVSRSAEAGARFAAATQGPGKFTFIAGDIGTPDGVKHVAAEIAGRTPKVHVLVNNAGQFVAAPLESYDEAQWDATVGLNLRAPFFLLQKLLPQLRAASTPSDPARVVNIGSIAGLWPRSDTAYAYGAAKSGLHHLTRMLASDLTRQGINVNAIAPGFFPSDMTAGFFEAVPGLEDQTVASIPAGRLGTPEDIGGAVLFLCSRAGAYVSGSVLPLEGGLWSA
jgi:NAD(P)-dependent dehydrogenase (short-subunit alcohol dehydrogenase family)